VKKTSPTASRGARAPRAPLPRISAELFGAALHGQSEGVFIAERRATKEGFKLVFANKSFCAMTGYSAAELTGRRHGFLHPEKAELARLRHWAAKAAPGRSFTGEGDIVRKNDTNFYAAWSYSAVADARGQPIGNGTNKLVNEIDAEIALASQLPAWCIGTPEEPTMKQAIAERVVMLTVFRDFVKNTLLAQTSRYTGAGELNRHGIVHGLFKGYGCEANFYKLVSFLDLLCFFIAIRTGSSGLAPDATAASVCLAGYYRSLSIVRAAAVAAGARPGSD